MAATGNPVTYTYVNVGTHTVTVTASDGSTTKTATWQITITQGGPPVPASTFTVSGATFSGGRWQAGVGQPITFTATEAHAQAWDWNFGDGDTASGQTVTHVFTRVGSPNVTVQVTGDGTNTVGQNAGAAGFTVFDPTTLAVGTNGRYQIQVSWASAQQGKSGTGTAVTLTPDSGYFWFFNPANIEVIVKVLDACNVDGFTWVFAGGLTSLEVQITVTDTLTGATKTYDNSEGTAFRPIQDTRFEQCTGSSATVVAGDTAAFGHAHAVDADARDGRSRSTSPRLASNFTGSVSYAWFFGDETCFPSCNPLTDTTGTESHTYAAPGTYNVEVTATSGSQSASANVSVTVSGEAHAAPSGAYTITGATRANASTPWIAPINQPVTFTALETHAASWAWDFGDGSTDSGATVTHTFTKVGNPTVTLTVTGDDTATFGTTAAQIHFSVTDPYTLRLGNGRFLVTANWATGTGASATSGHGTATSLTDDTGYFWFFNSSNTEVVVKALDACSFQGHYWIFASGLTSLGVSLTVTDSQTGTSQTYTNADGTAYLPVQDFTTFSACGGN